MDASQKRRAIRTLALAAALALFGVACYLITRPPDPGDRVTRFLEALERGDIDEIDGYTYFTPAVPDGEPGSAHDQLAPARPWHPGAITSVSPNDSHHDWDVGAGATGVVNGRAVTVRLSFALGGNSAIGAMRVLDPLFVVDRFLPTDVPFTLSGRSYPAGSVGVAVLPGIHELVYTGPGGETVTRDVPAMDPDIPAGG